MKTTFDLAEVAHLPSPEDNCAVAKRLLEPDTSIRIQNTVWRLDYAVLEGHRFAVRPIAKNQPLLSWGLPFGYALTHINSGNYVSNQGTLQELLRRQLPFPLPSIPNFRDHYQPYLLDESAFKPGQQVAPCGKPRAFQGYFRGDARGAGTRNYILILATNSKVGSYARTLARQMLESSGTPNGLDGIVAVAHTEAGSPKKPNNLLHVLRTLAGFAVHPNVAAVLILDEGSDWVDNQVLREYMIENRYPIDQVLHSYLTVGADFEKSMERGRRIIDSWMVPASRELRAPQPLARLKVALQCGGSDSFSGISSNPLLAHVAKNLLEHGGSANLAETNELVGAEAYILSNVSDLKTAYQFLFKIQEFKQMMKWHGHTPEQNPSGGNQLRGLYNIALKSIGAAQKRHPDVRLDYVIEYAEQMTQPGYYFMNSPGNDLESVAGQVASGANIVFFSTGNGSVTNFPFVPTIKVMSTSGRYQLLRNDMDIDAGAYLAGVPLEKLSQDMFDLTIKVASCALSKGEKAEHSQVSIWRNWQQTASESSIDIQQAQEPNGLPIELPSVPEPELRFTRIKRGEQVGLLLPNSLCSSEVARMLTERLNQITPELSISKAVSLSHTEGCGAVRGPSQDLLVNTLIGYMTHPMVKSCVMLEHGCENIHHQYLRRELLRRNISPEQFGWVSIQLDGGIEKAAKKTEEWFKILSPEFVNKRPFSVGILTCGALPTDVAQTLAELTRILVGSQVTVITPPDGHYGSSSNYFEALGVSQGSTASLRYGEQATKPGFHVMEVPSDHWVEIITGLGAAGAEALLAYVEEGGLQGHPFVPLILFSTPSDHEKQGVDLVLTEPQSAWSEKLLAIIELTLTGQYIPYTLRTGNTDSQIPRGPWGFSV